MGRLGLTATVNAESLISIGWSFQLYFCAIFNQFLLLTSVVLSSIRLDLT